MVQQPEVPWLEPIPDAMVLAEQTDPATIVTSRQSIRLALIAALQHLPPRQRAVLILRDVLKWRASEVAEVLDTADDQHRDERRGRRVGRHGWDVARACGQHHPIPPPLAEEMLELAPLFVTDADRTARFAAPIDVPPLASPGDRLIAFLGRRP